MRFIKLLMLFVFISCKPGEKKDSESLLIVPLRNAEGTFVAHKIMRKDSTTIILLAMDSISDGVQRIVPYGTDNTSDETLEFYNNGRLKAKHQVNTSHQEHGTSYYFYPSGYIESDRIWKNGKMVGLGTDYYDSISRIKAVLLYNNKGELVYRKTFDRHGNVLGIEGSKG